MFKITIVIKKVAKNLKFGLLQYIVNNYFPYSGGQLGVW